VAASTPSQRQPPPHRLGGHLDASRRRLDTGCHLVAGRRLRAGAELQVTAGRRGAAGHGAEANPLAGAGISPAAELQDPIAFLFFILVPIAFSFLSRGLIAFIFSVQGPLCKNLFLNTHSPPNNISLRLI
jgi:hypothetical protein